MQGIIIECVGAIIRLLFVHYVHDYDTYITRYIEITGVIIYKCKTLNSIKKVDATNKVEDICQNFCWTRTLQLRVQNIFLDPHVIQLRVQNFFWTRTLQLRVQDLSLDPQLYNMRVQKRS